MRFKQFGSVHNWVIADCFRGNSIPDSPEGSSAVAYQCVETGSLYIWVRSKKDKTCGYLFEFFTWCFDLADDNACDFFRARYGVRILNHLVRPEELEVQP